MEINQPNGIKNIKLKMGGNKLRTDVNWSVVLKLKCKKLCVRQGPDVLYCIP